MMIGDIEKVVLGQGVVTIFAVLLSYVKLQQEIKKSKSQKVYETKMDRVKRQLCEFYGPLYMLVASTDEVSAATWGTDIWEDVWRGIIIPARLQIENIMLSKIDLLDEAEIPKCYFEFLKHSQFNRAYINKPGHGTLSYFEKWIPYPVEFKTELRRAYERKREEYTHTLAEFLNKRKRLRQEAHELVTLICASCHIFVT